MIIEAFAKVNLSLEVYGTRPDGFHELKSIVAPISLADTLDITKTDDGSVSSDTGYGEKDLIVRAAHLLNVGARIKVIKRIPPGGGLGGGSADAAATLLALNELYDLGKTPDELATLGAAIGSDIPALVLAQHYHSLVLMEGRGEKVTLIPSASIVLPASLLVLLNPGVASSTAEVYKACRDRTNTARGWVNDLEEPAMRLYPQIREALEDLRKAGAQNAMMSGSGATVFGFARDEVEAEIIEERLKNKYSFIQTCRILIKNLV